jgi:hypothetical protein
VGGNSFNASVEPVTYDLPGRSNCTGCTFSEDFSNYWTAVLYYRAGSGTLKNVELFPNGGLAQSGGITVHYIPPYDGVSNVAAFKPVSFHLFSLYLGDPGARKTSPLLGYWNPDFVPLHYGRAETVANHILKVSIC